MSALHIRAPAALRSGTSRMLGLFEEGSDYARFGRPNRLFLQILGRWELIPVEKLLLIRNQEEIVDAHLRMTFTAESWAFAHYLLFAQVPMKRHAFSTFWAASKEGLSPHEALVRALGPEGAAHIDASLQSYLHGISYTVSLPYDHSGRGLSPLGAADPAEVEVALAKVGCVAQPALGLAHAEAAIAVAHGPEAYEIRAEILVRTHAPASRIREAVDAALAQGSHAAWILTHDAEGKLSQAGGRQASPTQNRAAVNQAEKAVRTDRDYQPAFDLLARALFYSDHVSRDDGKFLAFGREQFPDDRWLLVGESALARRTGQESQAAALETEALSDSPLLDPGQLTAVRAYLAALTSRG